MNRKGSIGIVPILTVLVILSIISIIVIPTMLKGYNNMKKEIFVQHVNEIIDNAHNVYLASNSDKSLGIHIYNIDTDLNNKDIMYKGYVVIDSRNINNIRYYIFINNKNYQLVYKDVTDNKVSTSDLAYYDSGKWLNIKNEYEACRTIESDISYDCLNREGYTIAQ